MNTRLRNTLSFFGWWIGMSAVMAGFWVALMHLIIADPKAFPGSFSPPMLGLCGLLGLFGGGMMWAVSTTPEPATKSREWPATVLPPIAWIVGLTAVITWMTHSMGEWQAVVGVAVFSILLVVAASGILGARKERAKTIDVSARREHLARLLQEAMMNFVHHDNSLAQPGIPSTIPIYGRDLTEAPMDVCTALIDAKGYWTSSNRGWALGRLRGNETAMKIASRVVSIQTAYFDFNRLAILLTDQTPDLALIENGLSKYDTSR